MSDESYTGLLTMSGFIISPLMALVVSIATEKRKDKTEFRKMLLNKKLEAAETFLIEYTYYLDSIEKLSHAQRSKITTHGTKSRQYLSEIIEKCQEISQKFNNDHRMYIGRTLLYFGINEPFTSREDNIKQIELTTNLTDLQQTLSEHKNEENRTKLNLAINEYCDWLDGFVMRRRQRIETIRNKIMDDLKDYL